MLQLVGEQEEEEIDYKSSENELGKDNALIAELVVAEKLGYTLGNYDSGCVPKNSHCG